MNISSRYTISFLLVILLASSNAYAQRNHHFGIDLSKTLIFNITSKGHGFIIEPIYLYSSEKSAIKFKLPIGYSHIERDNIFANSNLKTSGYYLKPGIGFSANEQISPFLNLILSRYKTDNKYTIKGDYFGDYVHEYSHDKLFLIGIEPNLDFNYKLFGSISMLISLRFSYIIYNSEEEKFPAYYLPGAGITHNEKYTGGINLFLIW